MKKKKTGRELGITLRKQQWGEAKYGRIHITARLFIGLRQSTSLTLEEIADHFGVTRREIRQYEKDLQSHPMTKTVLIEGLPSDYGIKVLFSAKCKKCSALISRFPCVSCCSMQGYVQRNTSETTLEAADAPTRFRPGTSQKVAVMAARVARGQSPFMDEDATHDTWHSATATFEETYSGEYTNQFERLVLAGLYRNL